MCLKNPVLAASGTVGYGEDLEGFIDPSLYGGIVAKSISIKPRGGNPLPRTVETAAGMLNSIGLENPGIESFCRDRLPRMRRYGTAIIVNIVGDTVTEYVELAGILDGEAGVDAIEVNVSCPNVPEGLRFGVEAEATRDLIASLRRATSRPIIAKLTPNAPDVVQVARAAADGGADAISLVNTFLGMAVDWRRRISRLGRPMGGLSGPAIKPMALRLVWEVARGVGIPVIGMGGIATAEDVLEFLVVGARAVQVGTAHFVRPWAVREILDGLKEALESEGIRSVEEIIGTFRPA